MTFAVRAVQAVQRFACAAAACWAAAGVDGARLRGEIRVATSTAPLFAAIGTAGATLPLITSAVASFIKLYLLLLFVRVLLTWFPNVDWMGQPWVTLRQVTDPYLNLFRNLIPPLMGQIEYVCFFLYLRTLFDASIQFHPDCWVSRAAVRGGRFVC